MAKGSWIAEFRVGASTLTGPFRGKKMFHLIFVSREYEYLLEKEMATHSGVLAWRISGTEVPGRLPSMGSHRVGHS